MRRELGSRSSAPVSRHLFSSVREARFKSHLWTSFVEPVPGKHYGIPLPFNRLYCAGSILMCGDTEKEISSCGLNRKRLEGRKIEIDGFGLREPEDSRWLVAGLQVSSGLTLHWKRLEELLPRPSQSGACVRLCNTWPCLILCVATVSLKHLT